MRVKRGLAAHRRHKKYLDMAKGFRGGRSRLYRIAREAVERSLNYAFEGRKLRKRAFRRLWIQRINAGARINGLSYSPCAKRPTSPPSSNWPSPSWRKFPLSEQPAALAARGTR